MKLAVALVTVVLLGSVAHADPTGTRHRTARLIGLGAAGIVYVTWETVAKPSLAPAACRWCTPSSFDAGVRESLVWHHASTAATISNITGYVGAPVTAASLLLLASRDRTDPWFSYSDDLIAVAEGAMYTQLIVQGFKYTVGRQRPYAHYMTGAYAPTDDDNLSFLSGHSALTFSLATTAGMVAHRRHTRYEPAIWAAGYTLAATTAYLRIAADKHYATDVIAGSILGVAGGLFIPILTGSLPSGVEVVPTGTGLAVAGVF